MTGWCSFRTSSLADEHVDSSFAYFAFFAVKSLEKISEAHREALLIRAGPDPLALSWPPLILNARSRARRSHCTHSRRARNLACSPAERVFVQPVRRARGCIAP